MCSVWLVGDRSAYCFRGLWHQRPTIICWNWWNLFLSLKAWPWPSSMEQLGGRISWTRKQKMLATNHCTKRRTDPGKGYFWSCSSRYCYCYWCLLCIMKLQLQSKISRNLFPSYLSTFLWCFSHKTHVFRQYLRLLNENYAMWLWKRCNIFN